MHIFVVHFQELEIPTKFKSIVGTRPHRSISVCFQLSLEVRDVQSQMRRCVQQPEDFEDLDALWGLPGSCLKVKVFLFKHGASEKRLEGQYRGHKRK